MNYLNNLNWRRIGLVALVLTPAVVLAALLARYAVNVPFWDQWELVTIIQNSHNGTLTFADFFAQHNEHRVMFPRFIMFGLAWLTQWNTLYEVVANVVLALASFWFLYLILRRTFANKKILFVALLLTSIILFSPDQFENWMWGWQIQWFLNVLGLVVAVWALYAWLHPRPWLRFAVAAIAASVATYSLASGFFVWIVCLPLLWFHKDLRKLLPWWIVIAAVVVGSHYIGYVDPAYHPSKTLFLHEPLRFIHYVLSYVALPIAPTFAHAVPVALAYISVALASGVYVIRTMPKVLVTSLLPWLSLGAYGVLAAASTGVSRLGLGVEQAFSSRYITLSCLLLIAVVVLLLKIIELRGRSRVAYLATAVLAVGVLLLGVNWVKGTKQIVERNKHLQLVQHCAHTAQNSADPCLLKVYPNAEVLWPRLQYLRSIHWGGL